MIFISLRHTAPDKVYQEIFRTPANISIADTHNLARLALWPRCSTSQVHLLIWRLDYNKGDCQATTTVTRLNWLAKQDDTDVTNTRSSSLV